MVSALTAEADSATVAQWLADHLAKVAISDWTLTEFAGALAMKRRMAFLSSDDWASISATWQKLLDDPLKIERVEARDFAVAARLVADPELKLRSGDALHLAIADNRQFSVATLDRQFAAAARRSGLMVEAILPHS